METLLQIFTDYTLRNVALGSAILGLVGGVLGAFGSLRRQSLLGDVLAHASLPGICLAFLLTGSKAPLILLLGAGVLGWVASLLMLSILRNTRLSEDSTLGVILSTFFGFGIGLLTFIQHNKGANQAGLDKFIFGQAATIIQSDVLLMSILGGLALACIYFLYKEFKIISFDPQYASSLGFPVSRLGTLLTSLTVIAVMIGLQTVGVVLMAAMLIASPAGARQWTNSLSRMILLSGVFGAISGVVGAVISTTSENLPTGPLVILVSSGLAIFSLLFAPERGIVWDYFRSGKNRKRFRLERLLLDAHVFQNHGELTPESLSTRRRVSASRAEKELFELKELGLAIQHDGHWDLTNTGDNQAHELQQNMRNLPKSTAKEKTA